MTNPPCGVLHLMAIHPRCHHRIISREQIRLPMRQRQSRRQCLLVAAMLVGKKPIAQLLGLSRQSQQMTMTATDIIPQQKPRRHDGYHQRPPQKQTAVAMEGDHRGRRMTRCHRQ